MFAREMLRALQKMSVLIAMGMLTFMWRVLVSMCLDFVAVRGVLVFMCAMPILWEMIFGKQGVPVCLCKWFTAYFPFVFECKFHLENNTFSQMPGIASV